MAGASFFIRKIFRLYAGSLYCSLFIFCKIRYNNG